MQQLPPKIITQQLHKNLCSGVMEGSSKLNYMLDLYEKHLIESTLNNYPSIRKASKILGVHYSTLSRKVKKYEIEVNVL